MSIFGSATEVADREAKNKIYGVVIGIVTKNNDKADSYRVRVRFPWLEHGGENDKPSDESHWARIASFMAGEQGGGGDGPRGAYFMPEVGDEVLVAFEHGDIARPIVIGRLWSDVGPTGGTGTVSHPVYAHTAASGKLATAVDEPGGQHNKTSHAAGHNDLSGIRTRSGHALVFNDAAEGAMYLRTKGNHRVELVDGGKQGILIADSGSSYVWLKSGSANGDIFVKSSGTITLDADKDIVLKAAGKITTQSGSETKMDVGSTFTMKSKGAMTLDAGGSGLIKSASGLTLAAPTIHLNKN